MALKPYSRELTRGLHFIWRSFRSDLGDVSFSGRRHLTGNGPQSASEQRLTSLKGADLNRLLSAVSECFIQDLIEERLLPI